MKLLYYSAENFTTEFMKYLLSKKIYSSHPPWVSWTWKTCCCWKWWLWYWTGWFFYEIEWLTWLCLWVLSQAEKNNHYWKLFHSKTIYFWVKKWWLLSHLDSVLRIWVRWVRNFIEKPVFSTRKVLWNPATTYSDITPSTVQENSVLKTAWLMLWVEFGCKVLRLSVPKSKL